MNKSKWIVCPKCGHKLFKLDNVREDTRLNLQTKCHSCKSLVRVIAVDGYVDAHIDVGDGGRRQV